MIIGVDLEQACAQSQNLASSPNITPTIILLPPTHFQIEAGDGVAHLTWDPMPNAKAYWISISDDGQNFTPRFKKAWIRTEINIIGLKDGKTYYYGISSVGFDGEKSRAVVQTVVPARTSIIPKWALQMTPSAIEGAFHGGPKEYAAWFSEQHFPVTGSPRAHFTPLPPPSAPADFKIEPGNGMAYLTWSPSPDATVYLLFISENGKNFKRRFKKPLHNHEVLISVLKNGKTYYYGVEAVGPYGDESKMTTQSVTPQEDAVISESAPKANLK